MWLKMGINLKAKTKRRHFDPWLKRGFFLWRHGILCQMLPVTRRIVQAILLYSWRFFRYSAPIHWLVHGHMTSNNETVSRQMPWAGNIAKTMTSNGKQFTVTREMLTAVARDQSVQLKVAWFCRRNPSAFFKICFRFVLLYNKSLNDWSLGKQWILFPENLNVSLDFVSGNIEILGKQNSLFPSGPVIECLMLTLYHGDQSINKSLYKSAFVNGCNFVNALRGVSRRFENVWTYFNRFTRNCRHEKIIMAVVCGTARLSWKAYVW